MLLLLLLLLLSAPTNAGVSHYNETVGGKTSDSQPNIDFTPPTVISFADVIAASQWRSLRRVELG